MGYSQSLLPHTDRSVASSQVFVNCAAFVQGWSELKFYGDQLGAGAQGAVRKARWKGNDYAVKVFKTSETTDFEEEVHMLSD